jgi:hypothetical protein
MTVLDDVRLMEEKRTSKGFIHPGVAFHVTPYNSRTIFDFFTPIGKASSMLTSYLFYLGKRGFKEVYKVEDWLEVSPVNAQYYQLTIQQKQQLERQIKEGLASISQSVADLELLLHDQRKYKEFLEYLEAVKKSGEEALRAEQTLKAIFVDEVDINTDLPQTPIALRSIVSRWPTIISDFMKLEDKDTDPKKIAEKLQVSEAEGVVLSTKNKLYKRWKEVFQDTVTSRYNRIRGLVIARERSVKEYRNMLRPYIERFRSIREMGEESYAGEKSKTYARDRYLRPTEFYRPAGEAVSIEFTKTWAWRVIGPAEFAKASREGSPGEKYDIKNWRSLPIAKGFKMKIADELQNNKKEFLEVMDDAGLSQISGSPTGADPLDDFVFDNYKKIEDHYGIKFSIIDILRERESFCEKDYHNSYYFMTMEIGALRSIFRTPSGVEFEDLWIEPFLMYFDTQNIILFRMLEISAKRKQDEAYIAEMLGETSEGKKTADLLKEEYPHLFGKEEDVKRAEAMAAKQNKKEEKKGKSIFEIISNGIKNLGIDVGFIKPGPYETHFDDRVTGIWFPDMQTSVYIPSVNMFKAHMQVPTFKAPT